MSATEALGQCLLSGNYFKRPRLCNTLFPITSSRHVFLTPSAAQPHVGLWIIVPFECVLKYTTSNTFFKSDSIQSFVVSRHYRYREHIRHLNSCQL